MTTVTKQYPRAIFSRNGLESVFRKFSFICLSLSCLWLAACSKEEDQSNKTKDDPKRSSTARPRRTVLEDDPNGSDRDMTDTSNPNLSYADLKPEEGFEEERPTSLVYTEAVKEFVRNAKARADENKMTGPVLEEEEVPVPEGFENEGRIWEDLPGIEPEEAPKVESDDQTVAPPPLSWSNWLLLNGWLGWRYLTNWGGLFAPPRADNIPLAAEPSRQELLARTYTGVGVIGDSLTTGFMMDLPMGSDLEGHPVKKTLWDLFTAGFNGWRTVFKDLQTKYREDRLDATGVVRRLRSWPKVIADKLGLTPGQLVHAGGDQLTYDQQWAHLISQTKPVDLVLVQGDRRDFCFQKIDGISPRSLAEMDKDDILKASREHLAKFEKKMFLFFVKMLKHQNQASTDSPMIVVVPHHSLAKSQDPLKTTELAAKIEGLELQCRWVRDGEGYAGVLPTDYSRAMCPLTASKKLTEDELVHLEGEYQAALRRAVDRAIEAPNSHPRWSPEEKAAVKNAWQKRIVFVNSLETWAPKAAHLSIDCFHWNRNGHEEVASQVWESLKVASR